MSKEEQAIYDHIMGMMADIDKLVPKTGSAVANIMDGASGLPAVVSMLQMTAMLAQMSGDTNRAKIIAMLRDVADMIEHELMKKNRDGGSPIKIN